MAERPLPDDTTLERYREEVTEDRANEQVTIAREDAEAIAEETDEVKASSDKSGTSKD